MLVKTYTELARELYNDFKQGQVEKMLESLDENIVWEAPLAGNLPFSGSYKGKAGLMQWLEILARSIDIQVFEPGDFIEQDGRVVAFVHTECIVLKNGRKAVDPEIHYWTFKGDKLMKFQSFSNTAAFEAVFETE